jgi:hypothetical protein
MEAYQLVTKENKDTYLEGLTQLEINEVIYQFHEYNSQFRVTSPSSANIRFQEFMEEVYDYTYCDVCGVNYHDEDPCAFH